MSFKINKYSILFLIIILYLILDKIIFYDKISIIIPTYNRDYIILNSIKSSLNQTYNNIEIIIIDDYSTDNTEKLIKKINDNRIKYLKLDKNYGASFARNIGINKANGKFIAFQDSDDIFHKDKLKKQLKNLKKFNSDMDFCKISVNINNSKYIIPKKKTEKKILKGDIFDELITNGNFISTQSILIKKSYIKNYLFDTRMPRLQDYDVILRMMPNIKISYTNEVLVDLYIQNDSITNSPIKFKFALNLLLKKKYNFTLNQNKKFLYFLKGVNRFLYRRYNISDENINNISKN